MKKIIINISVFASIFFLSGCEKYLSTIPDNRAIVTTPDQVTQLLTTAYPHRTYMPFAETLSDNAEDKGNAASVTNDPIGYNINLMAFKFADNTQNIGDDSPIGYFYECYRAIATANQALVYCSNADSASYTAQKGEALLCRAYAHFMLTTFFAKVYDSATASTDPGIPYVTTVETNPFAKYNRQTVQYDYDMIEKDINTGIPLLNEKIYGSAPRFHFNVQAAHAFAARFYLFKKNYAKVVSESNLVFGSTTPATLLRNENVYRTYQYGGIAAVYSQATENANLLLQEVTSTYGDGFYGFRYGYGNNLFYSLINATNVTGGTYAQYYMTYGASPNFFNIPKFNPIYNSTTGVSTMVVPLLSTEEALLNRVEANIMLKNYASAITDMNAWISQNVTTTKTVTTSSILTFYNTNLGITNQDSAMIQATLDFKRVSFIHEGLRWLDILRLKMPITHTSNDGFSSTLVAGDKRRLLQLPNEAVTAGVPLNPR
jgi:hypothetical protein